MYTAATLGPICMHLKFFGPAEKWLVCVRFSVNSLWFRCRRSSVHNFTRLMTLSHTREASLTKIQRHNVRSVSVSFFFFCHPPFSLHIQKAFQSGYRTSWIPPCFSGDRVTMARGGLGAVEGSVGGWGRCAAMFFAKQMEKHHCVALAFGQADFLWRWFHGLRRHSSIHYKMD